SFVLLLQPHPTSPLFPYTTLFRSLAAPRRRAQPVERGPAAGAVSRRAERRQPLALEPVDVCADLENWNRQLVSAGDELAHADDDAPMLLDLPLLARRRLGALALEPARLQPPPHPAH